MKKWNYEKRKYEEYNPPEGWNYSTHCQNMKGDCVECPVVVTCASCFMPISCSESFTSLEIHNDMGFGYIVCKKCYEEEMLRRLPMKIILDDTYTLKGDAYCCWITEKRVTEEGKEYEEPVSGYYPTFGMAMEGYIERKIRGDKVTSLTALKREIAEIKKQVKHWKAKAVQDEI